MQLVYCTCNNCQKAIIDWNGEIRIKQRYSENEFYSLYVLCEACLSVKPVFSEARETIKLEDILYGNFRISNLKAKITDEAREKISAIIKEAERVSATQLTWIHIRDKRSYGIKTTYRFTEEEMIKLRNIDKQITFYSFYKVIQHILEVYMENLNDLSKSIGKVSDSSEFLRAYHQKKVFKQKLIKNAAMELLQLDTDIPYYNDLLRFVQNRITESLENNNLIADCISWITFELDKYLIDTSYSRKQPTFSIS